MTGDSHRCPVVKILPRCLTYCPGDHVKLKIPSKYGKVLHWEKKDVFSDGYNPVHEAGRPCGNILLLTPDQLSLNIMGQASVYRAVLVSCPMVKNQGRKVYTNSVCLKPLTVTIIKQPQSICLDSTIPDPIQVKVKASSDCSGKEIPFTIQWQKRNINQDAKAPWVSIPGASGEVAPLPYQPGDQFRAVVTSACGQIISQLATVGFVAIVELQHDDCADEATVIYQGIPSPQVEWYHENELLGTGDTLLRTPRTPEFP